MGVFDDIPMWARPGAPEPPPPPTADEQRAQAIARMAELEELARQQFEAPSAITATLTQIEAIEPPKKRGRPPGSKDRKPRARLAASGTSPASDSDQGTDNGDTPRQDPK